MFEDQTWQLSGEENPPYKAWVDRCATQMLDRDPGLKPQVVSEQAGAYFFLGRGKYTPEEMGDIMTGYFEPLLEYAHLISSSGRMNYSAQHPLVPDALPAWARP
ncbi:MAG: hypothetical protein EOO70_03305 [Myxococcaceae bacterium]|nr:MAG: hypothetical protein EOO70_03305 [Myxococcaceae bacterium]